MNNEQHPWQREDLAKLFLDDVRGGIPLAAEQIDAEVIDLRTLRPLDTATILDSVSRTHRAVVIDEGWRTGSLAAEVSAQIMEGAFDSLDAPVARVCSAEVPMPYAKHLEDAAMPQAAMIAATVRSLL